MPDKRAGSSPAPGTMEKDLFRKLNPERHGRDSTGMCFVCGYAVEPGKVFCKAHSLRWKLTKPKMDMMEPTIYWTLRQPDFNGRGTPVVVMNRQTLAEWCNWKHA